MAIPRSPRPNSSYPPHKQKRRPADQIRSGREAADVTTESVEPDNAKR